MTVAHFIPLIGPFELARQRLNRDHGFKLKVAHTLSFPAFAANESHLMHNYPKVNIDYVPEESLITQDNSVNLHRELVRNKRLEATDLVLAVPPCSGLSTTNTGPLSGAYAPQNRFIYESVKFFVAQGAKALLLENAPTMTGSDRGGPVVQRVKAILNEHLPGQHALHLIKTTTLRHGLPQDRRRTFLIAYRTEDRFHKRLRSFTRTALPLPEFLDDVDKRVTPGDPLHVPLQTQEGDEWWRLLNERRDLFKKVLVEQADKNLVQVLDTFYKEWRAGKLEMSDKPKVLKFFEHVKYKAEIDKPGFYDSSSPIMYRNNVNAIMHKYTYRIIHPTLQNRYLTMRELMCLMGIPVDFMLKEPLQRNFNAVCQNVPVDTAMDAIRWACDLIDPKYKEFTTVRTDDVIIQDDLRPEGMEEPRNTRAHEYATPAVKVSQRVLF